MQQLPTGWSRHKLGDLIELKYGIALPQKNRTNDGSPVFGSNGKIGEHTPALTDGETLIIGRKGSIGEVHYSPVGCTPIDTTYYIDNVHEKTFRYWFHSLKNLNLGRLNKSTAIPGLSRNDVYDIDIPVPPINEQRRIADKLDRVLARVDAANEHLSRVAPIIKHFRQSVLEAAIAGRLTEDWRKHDKYKTTTARMGDIGKVTGGLTKNAKRAELPLRKAYLRVANVYSNEVRLEEVLEIGLTESEYEKTKLTYGDLLIVEGNGSIDQIGRVAMWKDELPECSHQNHLIRWRRSNLNIVPEFILAYLLSPAGRTQIISAASSTSGLHTLSVSKISALELNIPPVEEQSEIVRRVEKLLAFADRLEERLSQAQAAVQKLTPALLAKAFRGELVPQDPNDEPASELLKRLQESRTDSAKPSRARKPRTKKSR